MFNGWHIGLRLRDSTSLLLIIRNSVLTLCAVSVAYIFFRLSFFTHPSEADDFCFANQFRALGIWKALVDNYLFWSGGYTSTLISGVIGAKTNFIEIYKFLPLTLLAATISSATYFVCSIFRVSLTNLWSWLGGLGFTLLFISIMPAVVSGFYWFNGAVTYQLANIFLMLTLAQCIRIIDQSIHGKVRCRSFFVLALAIAFGIGCTETVMAEIVIMISLISTWRIIIDQHNRREWLIILLLTIAFFLIYALAPGNTHRASHIANKEIADHAGYDFLAAYKASVYFGFRELITILSNAQLWWATCLYILLFKAYAGTRIHLKEKIRRSHIVLGMLVTLLIPIVLQFPSQFIISIFPAQRTQNSIYFGFLLAWFCTWTLVTIKYIRLPYLGSSNTRLSNITSLIASLFLAYFVVVSYNIKTALYDLANKAQNYDATLKKRYADVRAAIDRGEQYYTVDTIADPPSTINLISKHLNQSTTNHVTCFSRYIGIEALNYR